MLPEGWRPRPFHRGALSAKLGAHRVATGLIPPLRQPRELGRAAARMEVHRAALQASRTAASAPPRMSSGCSTGNGRHAEEQRALGGGWGVTERRGCCNRMRRGVRARTTPAEARGTSSSTPA